MVEARNRTATFVVDPTKVTPDLLDSIRSMTFGSPEGEQPTGFGWRKLNQHQSILEINFGVIDANKFVQFYDYVSHKLESAM